MTEHSTIVCQGEARRRPLGALALACVLALLALTGCGSSESFRYRMTVYVDTPAGQRSGSSVIEVTTSTPAPLMPTSAAYSYEVRGEAVAVDLPGGTVFALLTSPAYEDGAYHYPFAAYPSVPGEGILQSVERIRRQTAVVRLPRDRYPQFVRFGNPHDVTTMVPVGPSYFDSSFGRGVRLNRIEIQITDDPVTETIEARLPNFGAGSGFDPYQQHVDRSDFRKGFR